MEDAPKADLASGIVVIDKPQGWTSHQVVGRSRRVLATRKVGHAGTLDPMATGVLVVGVNRATRLLGHLMLTEKEYLATMRLGVGTNTDDAEGEITGTPGAEVTAEEVEAALGAYRGDILQVPTAVSAIKVDGRRAYARVRAGEEVELKARPVTVHELTLGEVRPDLTADGVPVVDCDLRVRCSSGTYIRALARDIGRDLGTQGHLTALRRTAVGPFTIDRAEPIDQETESLNVIPIDEVAVECFPTVEVDPAVARKVANGSRLKGTHLDTLTAVMSEGRFLALYAPDAEDAAAEAVFTTLADLDAAQQAPHS